MHDINLYAKMKCSFSDLFQKSSLSEHQTIMRYTAFYSACNGHFRIKMTATQS